MKYPYKTECYDRSSNEQKLDVHCVNAVDPTTDGDRHNGRRLTYG